MESVLFRYPALFVFIGAIALILLFVALFEKARFPLFLATLLLATGLILSSYFLGASVEELLAMGLCCYLASIGSFLLSRLRRKEG